MTSELNANKQNQPKKRRTIGMLIDWFEKEYQAKIIAGAIKIAQEHDINLFCIEGGCIHTNHEYEISRNRLFTLINENEFDGLIIFAASIGLYASEYQIRSFCKQFGRIPVVTVAHDVKGVHSVLIENSVGLKELITHLVKIHHYQKFAFISGPKDNFDSQCRYQTLIGTLAEFGIPFDDDLVAKGDFTVLSGTEALRTLLARKKPFEVVFAANDLMAIGAMQELAAQNIRVPDEIAVVGFDDIEISAFSSPPLTTVEQSFQEQGIKAMELLLDLIKHPSDSPIKVLVPTKMVLRDSCGCFSQMSSKTKSEEPIPIESDSKINLIKNKGMIIRKIINNMPPFFLNEKKDEFYLIIEQMIDGLYGQLIEAKKDEFVKVFSQIILKTDPICEYVSYWQNLLTEFRRIIIPLITENQILIAIEDSFHEVRIMLAEKGMSLEKKVFDDILAHNSMSSSVSEELLFATSVPQLVKVLGQRLPQIEISTCYIAQYSPKKDKAKSRFKLDLAYNNNGHIKIEKENAYFESLVPDIILSDQKQHLILVMMLYLSKNDFGIIGFEINMYNRNLYGTLRRIINSSLRGLILSKLVRSQEKHLLSQQVQLHLKNLDAVRKAMEGFISTILLTIEIRDPYTAGHQHRVASLASAIATEMELPQEIIESVRMAGILHDLGKISIPVEILNKPGRLKTTEFMLIKEHPTVAYEILKNIDFPWPLAQIILQHHERIDGTGYPNGLKGEEIRLEARILTVADVIEAMASHRPYRPALGIEEALAEISKYKGIHYDPQVVEACMYLFKGKGYQLNSQNTLM